MLCNVCLGYLQGFSVGYLQGSPVGYSPASSVHSISSPHSQSSITDGAARWSVPFLKLMVGVHPEDAGLVPEAKFKVI